MNTVTITQRFSVLTLGALGMCPLLAGCVPAGRVPDFEVAVYPWVEPGVVGRRFTSPHFEIYSTLLNDKLETGLPAVAEASYGLFTELLPPEKPAEQPLTVYVFGRREQWDVYVQNRVPDQYPLLTRIHTGGYTDPAGSYLFHRSPGTTLASFVHEAWHQYTGTRFGARLPAWLEEGLACYVESIDVAGEEPVFRPLDNAFRTDGLRLALFREQLLPLSTLLATSPAEVLAQGSREATYFYYAQVWGLVAFLRHNPVEQIRRDFAAMLNDISAGEFSARLSAALVTDGDLAGRPFGEQVFRMYFDADPEELDEPYADFLVNLADLHRIRPAPAALAGLTSDLP